MKNIAIIHWMDEKSCFFDSYIKNLEKSLNAEKFDVIISSWWFTNKNINKSEAQSIKDSLVNQVNFEWQWILEEKAFTTFENVKFCAEILEDYDDKNITVFCWNTHLPKITYLSLREYLKLSKNEALNLIQNTLKNKEILEFDWFIKCEIWGIKFVWVDLWADKKDFGKAIWSSILETHYDDCPELHEEFLEIRKKLWWIK